LLGEKIKVQQWELGSEQPGAVWKNCQCGFQFEQQNVDKLIKKY
jgi:hypothetical protein